MGSKFDISLDHIVLFYFFYNLYRPFLCTMFLKSLLIFFSQNCFKYFFGIPRSFIFPFFVWSGEKRENTAFKCYSFSARHLNNFTVFFFTKLLQTNSLRVMVLPFVSILTREGNVRGCIVFKYYGFSSRHFNNFTMFFDKAVPNTSLIFQLFPIVLLLKKMQNL